MNFQAIGTVLQYIGILVFRTCWCPSPFSAPSITPCFSIYFSSPAVEFNSFFFFTTDVGYLHSSVDPSFTHFLGEFPGWDWLWYPMLWSQERRRGAREAEISRFKFLLWPGFEPRILHSGGRERYHSTTTHPLNTYAHVNRPNATLSLTLNFLKR